MAQSKCTENSRTTQCQHLPKKLHEYVFCQLCNQRMCPACAVKCGHSAWKGVLEKPEPLETAREEHLMPEDRAKPAGKLLTDFQYED